MGRPRNPRQGTSALEAVADGQLRVRIATELRNSTLQAASALAINLGVVRRLAGPLSTPARAAMKECLELAEQCQREIRIFSYLLSPSADEFGLRSALTCYLSAFGKRNGCKIAFNMDAKNQLPRAVEIVVFRAIEESLAKIENEPALLRRIQVCVRIARSNVSVTVSSGTQLTASLAATRQTGNYDAGLLEIQRRIYQMGGQMAFWQGNGTMVSKVKLPQRQQR